MSCLMREAILVSRRSKVAYQITISKLNIGRRQHLDKGRRTRESADSEEVAISPSSWRATQVAA